jgi:hypothetical protein
VSTGLNSDAPRGDRETRWLDGISEFLFLALFRLVRSLFIEFFRVKRINLRSARSDPLLFVQMRWLSLISRGRDKFTNGEYPFLTCLAIGKGATHAMYVVVVPTYDLSRVCSSFQGLEVCNDQYRVWVSNHKGDSSECEVE